jgi:outer membrane protein assembly factor BamB
MTTKNNTDRYTWPSPRGPYNGNASFALDLVPPLNPVWEHGITAKYNDGMRVGGRGKVLVPTRGKEVQCLALSDGHLLWQQSACRRSEEECYLAGAHLWSKLGGNPEEGFRVSVIAIESGIGQIIKAPSFIPVGVYADQTNLVYRQRNGIIRLDDLRQTEKRPGFFGRIDRGLAYGALDDGSGALMSVDDESFSLSCHDPATSKIRWLILPENKSEGVVSVAGEVVVSYAFEEELRVRSTADGQILWHCPTRHDWQTLPPFVISEGLVIHWEDRLLTANEMLTGKVAWTIEACNERTNLIATKKLLWVGMEGKDGKYRLMALEKATGKTVWELKVKARLVGYALSLIDDSLVCVIGRKLVCYRSN